MALGLSRTEVRQAGRSGFRKQKWILEVKLLKKKGPDRTIFSVDLLLKEKKKGGRIEKKKVKNPT